MKKIIYFTFLVFACLMVSRVTARANEEYVIKLSKEADMVKLFSNEASELSYRGVYTTDKIDDFVWYIEHGYVEYIEPNYEVEMFSDYADELYRGQWYHEIVKSEAAWDLSVCGNGINVGVIDSGCYSHIDLSGRIKSGYNIISNKENDVKDNIGHGTHVSGIIASAINGEGIIGIANKANIVPIKCFDSGTSTKVLDIAAAIYKAVDVYDCKVLNMSFGIANDSQTLQDAINYAHDRGVIMIAAVGNKGSDVMYYPAAYDTVIGVGAIDKNMERCDFSQYNNSVFVVAPGKNILSLGTSQDNYLTMNGTSQSAPMVTALVCVLLSCDDTLSNDQIMKCLEVTSYDLGDVGYDNLYGYGLINIDAAIQYVLQKTPYFISPMSNENDIISVRTLNNTNDSLSGILSICAYNEIGQLKDFYTQTIELNSKSSEEYFVPMVVEHSYIKCFLWEGVDSMTPLCKSRTLIE